MRFRVTHIEGSRKGAVENYDVPVLTVGRDPSCLLAFDPIKDDRVSTRHASIAEQGGQVLLTDLNARNGTLVNGARIQGSVPLLPGALIQFGDGGPMIALHFEAAAAPAPAPAPAAPPPEKKSGGKGCVVLVLLGALAVPCLGGGGYLVYTRYFGMSAPTIPSSDPRAIAKEFGKAIDKPDKPEEKKPGPVESPWKKVGVGTKWECEVATKSPAFSSKMKQSYELVERTEQVAKLKVENHIENVPDQPATTMELPLDPKPSGDEVTKTLEEKDESVTVPAGTFDCAYRKVESKHAGNASVTESWTPKDFPWPVKSRTKTGDVESESVMTRLEKK